MAEVVYVLCAATSLACAIMLLSSYRRSGTKLLFWSGLCFAGLTLNNVLLFIDLVVAPGVDLSLWRSTIALASMTVLIYGLVWETR
jgi:hypothetical protein